MDDIRAWAGEQPGAYLEQIQLGGISRKGDTYTSMVLHKHEYRRVKLVRLKGLSVLSLVFKCDPLKDINQYNYWKRIAQILLIDLTR